MLGLASERHIIDLTWISSLAHEIHSISLDIELILFIPRLVPIVIFLIVAVTIVVVLLIEFLFFLVDDVSIVPILDLENGQTINIKQLSKFYVHVPFYLHLITL